MAWFSNTFRFPNRHLAPFHTPGIVRRPGDLAWRDSLRGAYRERTFLDG